jgi:hypothetical protein
MTICPVFSASMMVFDPRFLTLFGESQSRSGVTRRDWRNTVRCRRVAHNVFQRAQSMSAFGGKADIG